MNTHRKAAGVPRYPAVALFPALVMLAANLPAGAAKPRFDDAFSPHQGATSLIVSTLGEAEKSVYVAAYSFTSKRIAAALVKAHDRGVDVEIVMDASDKDSWQAREISEQGIPVRLNDRYGIMHNKFMVIDGETLELGSFNYTIAAENQNAENVLVIHNVSDIAQDYARQWRKLWDEGRPFASFAASQPAASTGAPPERNTGAPPENNIGVPPQKDIPVPQTTTTGVPPEKNTDVPPGKNTLEPAETP